LLPDYIEKVLPTKVIEDAYDDLASTPLKESSKIAVDLVKTTRLLLAPLQIAAGFQDRFERFVDRLRSAVPEERQQEAPAEIIGPALQHMQFLDDDNPLWQMFEKLLTAAIDTEAVSTVHPSFVQLIAQLSRDEALILLHLQESSFEIVDTLDLIREKNRFENRIIEKSSIPVSELWCPDQVHLYYSHLESLALVRWPVEKEDVIRNDEKVQTGIRRYSRMILTPFGELFTAACIPNAGFSKP